MSALVMMYELADVQNLDTHYLLIPGSSTAKRLPVRLYVKLACRLGG